MNEEIKEILDYIDDRIIPNEKWNKIKDYITNLQQKYDKLQQGIKIEGNSIQIGNKVCYCVDKDLIDYIVKLQQIEKEHQNCTRKHWQQKCFEHSANEKIYKSRIKKIRNYVNSTDFIYDEQYKKKDKIENILNGSDEK